MSRKRQKMDDRASLAAERGSEDGVDPRDFHAKPWDAPKQATRKGRQLCAQVKDALHVALAACADEVLQALVVVSVDPAPNTARLLVQVAAGEADRSAAEAALARAAGHLRAEAAAAICRRYMPELIFVLV